MGARRLGNRPIVRLGLRLFFTIAWVGGTELVIVFTVADAESEAPIADARIEIHSDGGFYEARAIRELTLTTDANGVARKQCGLVLTSGTQSGLRFTNTSSVQIPDWQYCVKANGFETAERADLLTTENVRRVRRTGPGKTMLTVPVLLKKSAGGETGP